MNRRTLLAGLAAGAGAAALGPAAGGCRRCGGSHAAHGLAAQEPAAPAPPPRAGSGEQVGELYMPQVAGKGREPTIAKDNDREIMEIEKRLKCTCPCSLDVYTCRTTDFTCEYSPALHKEVIALHDEGKTAQEIFDAFVARYGEKILTAPKPEGFNVAGYVVPGILLALGGGVLAWLLHRRMRPAPVPAGAVGAIVPAPPPAPDALSTDDKARLERALAELES